MHSETLKKKSLLFSLIQGKVVMLNLESLSIR